MTYNPNREEGEKCIAIARKYILERNRSAALKFLTKAIKLVPERSDSIKSLITQAEHLLDDDGDDEPECSSHNGYSAYDHYDSANTDDPPDATSTSDAKEDETNLRHRATNSERKRTSSQSSKKSPKGSKKDVPEENTQEQEKTQDYTQEQYEAVQRIRHCKDYYEILSLEKKFSESDLKKSYRRLALILHPDKNSCPGAEQAFKAVGSAYAVLSNPEKRRKYDTYGTENPQPARNSSFYDFDYSRGFDEEFSPEEIFHMFFGGGFPSGSVYRRRHHGPGGTYYYYDTRRRNTEHQEREESGLTVLLQLMPFLFLVFFSLLSSLLFGDSAFSLHRTEKYTIPRKTTELNIPYYVKPDFLKKYSGSLHKIERQVEEEYIDSLRSNCYRERLQKEHRLWQARAYGDSAAYDRATSHPTPSCDKLNRFY